MKKGKQAAGRRAKKKLDKALIKHEEKNNHIFENARECIIVTDLQGNILACNNSCETMFGYLKKGLVKKALSRIIHPEYRYRLTSIKQQLKEKGHAFFEIIAVRKDGKPLPIELFSVPIVYDGKPSLLNIIRNNIEHKKIEFANHSHLNMMNEMASSLAHELNQQLSSIVNYSRGSIRRLQEGSYRPEDLIIAIERVIKQAERAAALIQRLRGFVCYGKLQHTNFDLNEVVKEAVVLLESEYKPYDVKINIRLSKRAPKVNADKIQIEQVLINIIKNAIEAVRECDLRQRMVSVATNLVNSKSVAIVVCDKGRGLDEEIIKKIFEPFFTTKSQGMGMGLTISRTIVDAHDGQLLVSSDFKKGTCFKVILPINRGK